MTEELNQLLQEQGHLWHQTRRAGMQLGFWGWERQLRLLTNTKNSPPHSEAAITKEVIDCMPLNIDHRENKATNTVTQWTKWFIMNKSNKYKKNTK